MVVRASGSPSTARGSAVPNIGSRDEQEALLGKSRPVLFQSQEDWSREPRLLVSTGRANFLLREPLVSTPGLGQPL